MKGEKRKKEKRKEQDITKRLKESYVKERKARSNGRMRVRKG